MDFISNREAQIREMLASMGISSIEELFKEIPEKLLLPPLYVNDGLSEYEGMLHMEQVAAKNHVISMDSYMGGGAYEHHIPALVASICQKSEFLTAYTPYQAEASQGGLQTIFEFQSAICALTGMDASNASVYDGASACAEALLMAVRQKRKAKKVLIAATLNPFYRKVVDQYLDGTGIQVLTLPYTEEGRVDVEELEEQLDESIAAVLIQSPNFFGVMEESKAIFSRAKESGAISILCANPMAYGVYASAGQVGADIAVGDTQPFGIPLQFGGPYVGYVACKQPLIRQLPGRIVGETFDTQGRRGFVLTLQAREQHIRRDKATSNICSNQALAALASLIAMLWYGKEGLPRLTLTNFQRTMYLKSRLAEIEGISMPFNEAPVFNEFVVRFEKPIKEVVEAFQDNKIDPGIYLSRFYPELDDCLLVAVTETKSFNQLERYINVAKEFVRR